jgi:hypothetical protein
VTPSGDEGLGATSGAGNGGIANRLTRRKENQSPTWPRLLVIAAVLVLAYVFAQTCQKSQIRVDQDEAVAAAQRQIDFTPELTQVRLLRQGISRKAYWFVSLSVPDPEVQGAFLKLSTFRVDANTGEVLEIEQAEARDAEVLEKGEVVKEDQIVEESGRVQTVTETAP